MVAHALAGGMSSANSRHLGAPVRTPPPFPDRRIRFPPLAVSRVWFSFIIGEASELSPENYFPVRIDSLSLPQADQSECEPAVLREDSTMGQGMWLLSVTFPVYVSGGCIIQESNLLDGAPPETYTGKVPGISYTPVP